MEKVLLAIYTITFILYFVHNIYCYKNKKIIYVFNRNYKKGDFTVLNDEYYKIQIITGITNCSLMAIYTVTYFTSFNERYLPLYTSFYVGTFLIINYLLKKICIKMDYAQFIN